MKRDWTVGVSVRVKMPDCTEVEAEQVVDKIKDAILANHMELDAVKLSYIFFEQKPSVQEVPGV